jgi:hypothetical protein
MMVREFLDRNGITLPDLPEQVLRLVLELIEVGTDGKMTARHDEPPWKLPAVR